MRIKFHGQQSNDEVVESVMSMMKLFKDRYGIADFQEMDLDMTLLNQQGEEVELIDANTSEVLEIFEIYKSVNDIKNPRPKTQPKLQLVVDNTK